MGRYNFLGGLTLQNDECTLMINFTKYVDFNQTKDYKCTATEIENLEHSSKALSLTEGG